ncbi:lipid A export permease/ATP-binding protein MsbA [Alteromonadaceae bacterium M269]|nr:lipid A export permease/ATP-binding protein MsbA [Alteromonadaceae bacterium M269]
MSLSKPQSTFRRFRQYLAEFKLAFIVAGLGMIGYASVDGFVIAQLKVVTDKSLVTGDYAYLRLAAYAIVPLMILRGLSNFIGTYMLSWVGNRIVMRMRQQLFEQYIHLPVSFHDNNSTGALISKALFDTEQVANAAGKAFAVAVREGAFVIFLLATMFYYSWKLSLIFFVIGPIVGVIVSGVSKRFRKISKQIQQAMGSLTSSIEQVLKGHKEVLMFGAQSKESERFADKNNYNRQQNMKLVVAKVGSVVTVQIIASIALAVVLFVASMPGAIENLTAGTFIALLVAMTTLLKPIKQLTTVNSELQRGMAACASIFETLDKDIEADNGKIVLKRSEGKLRFDDVTFTYEGKDQPAINGVSFEVSAGSSIALVGRSGSGKSTISNLLTRFYDLDVKGIKDGKGIYIDDLPIQDIKLKDLRNQFALVSQNVTLFNDTIANNIAYGVNDSVSRKEIEEAAKVAHVIEFADELENGLDTEIGENGSSLSGGQRQRIAIARAILRDAPILILDEATSALDTESERLIQDALDTLQQDRTSLVVAHRLSTIENADTILVVEQGEVVERGNHQSLIEQDGMYAQLHKIQFGEVTL